MSATIYYNGEWRRRAVAACETPEGDDFDMWHNDCRPCRISAEAAVARGECPSSVLLLLGCSP